VFFPVFSGLYGFHGFMIYWVFFHPSIHAWALVARAYEV
jgi:hypothetical protein